MLHSSSVVGDVDLTVLLHSDLLSGRAGGPVLVGWNRQVYHRGAGFFWLIDVKW